MTNLVIGLCLGLASAIALAVMWRMAERLRKELQSSETEPLEQEQPHPDEGAKSAHRGS
jgi:hypothetical protein